MWMGFVFLSDPGLQLETYLTSCTFFSAQTHSRDKTTSPLALRYRCFLCQQNNDVGEVGYSTFHALTAWWESFMRKYPAIRACKMQITIPSLQWSLMFWRLVVQRPNVLLNVCLDHSSALTWTAGKPEAWYASYGWLLGKKSGGWIL